EEGGLHEDEAGGGVENQGLTRDAEERARDSPGSGSAAAEEEMPHIHVTRERAIGFAVFILAAVAFLYFVLPNLPGVGTAVHHIENGDKWWIAIGVLFELLSFAGYVVLFRAVLVRGRGPIGWRESY